jgi:prepilin-type N-terminal cleavage/methylation domain-containing protein/prepilin-type processing-associated H-X9-DG protein
MGGRFAMRKSGFTLIELLVVIAIIAILAAILFPVFARAREKARQASCLSNLKQIALGVMMYAQDFDELLPYYQRPFGVAWYDDLQPYLKNRGITVCPSKRDWNPSHATHKTGYGLNETVFPSGLGSPTPPASVSLAQIYAPSETIGGADKNQGNAYIVGTSFSGSVAWPYNVDTRHNDGANFFFLDGHAKWMARNADWSTSDTLWDLN